MQSVLKNWKTSLGGVAVVIIAGLLSLGYINQEAANVAGLILAGLGLVAAKDGDVQR